MAHDSEQQAFLRAIIENPDDTVRLVDADQLQEHGQPEYAEFIRAQIGLASTTVMKIAERPATARWGLVREAPGPDQGTYVVVFHLSAPLAEHVVGRLGTFDLPAGYYFYVGSAFGAGGVAARVGRHLTPDTVKKWNVDHLKDRATPVEVWWTHDTVRREHAWSEALASTPGLTSPAPGFGSNDCKTCPAHLYHTEHPPVFRRFDEAVRRIDGHAPVFRAVVPPRSETRATQSQEQLASTKDRNDECREAIEAIAANCGGEAHALLRSDHPFLTPAVVMSLARTAPERQVFELAEVRAGRRPFTAKTDVFDTTGYGEVGSRLARAGGYINKFACAVARSVTGNLSRKDRDDLDRAAKGLLRHCGALWAEVRRAYAARPADWPDEVAGFGWQPPRDWSELETPSVRSIVAMLGAPTAFVGKCVRDLRHVPELPRSRRFWPTRGQAHSLGVKLFEMSQQLLRAREQIAGVNVGITACIVTHNKPDADALVAAWLAERYLLPDRRVEVAFVPSGHNWTSGPAADCVVDVGGLCDPALGLFDHRPPARADRTETCATELVWKHLSESGRDVEGLRPLVDAVRAGDSTRERGKSVAYAASRREGVHALIAGLRARGAGDREMWDTVRNWLNVLHASTT